VRARASIAAGLIAVVVACTGINAQTYSYATLDDARRAGAVERGWLPDGLPPGAYEIRVAHVPNSPQRWGLFNFPPGEGEVLQRMLAPEEVGLEG
jgi:hypothetical protein